MQILALVIVLNIKTDDCCIATVVMCIGWQLLTECCVLKCRYVG